MISSVCFSRVIEEGASVVGKTMEELSAGDRNDPLFDDDRDDRLIERKGRASRLITTKATKTSFSSAVERNGLTARA